MLEFIKYHTWDYLVMKIAVYRTLRSIRRMEKVFEKRER